VNLSGYDNIKKLAEQDKGTDIFTLVRVSHIHLFGISFIFFIVGIVFSHAYVRPLWIKYLVIGAPFVCLIVDVSSWYMVKIYHPIRMGDDERGRDARMCFAFMWVTSMYQMWIGRTPKAVLERVAAIVG